MGMLRDFINSKVIGSEVRKTINTAKGKKKESKLKTCEFCGKTKTKIIANCQKKGKWEKPCMPGNDIVGPYKMVLGITKKLCKDCAKKCKKCGKYYCPEHINKHKCI